MAAHQFPEAEGVPGLGRLDQVEVAQLVHLSFDARRAENGCTETEIVATGRRGREFFIRCIRCWTSMHPRDMNLSAEEMTLVVAARNGERGALRSLAVSLDERLGDDDVCLDGAVIAWRAVKGSSRRSVRSMATVLNDFGFLRRRFPGTRILASAAPVSPPKPGDSLRAQDHRPAA